MRKLRVSRILWILILAAGLTSSSCVRPNRQPDLRRIFQFAAQRTGKTPIIIIPGILGSRLINKDSGQEVWPRLGGEGDGLELPISPDLKSNRDNLVATEVVVTAKISFLLPELGVYEQLIEALTKYAGYRRGNIDNPAPGGDEDTFYLFSYDWRHPNVENAQLLAQKIDALKQKLGRPNLQFNLIGHSMGGLIGRYYAMYGGVDVRNQPQAKVTWAGAPNINKLVMVGTPNEGTMDALRTLVEGYSIYGGDRRRFSLFNQVTNEVAFSMPAAFELLPHRGTEKFYDAQMQPLSLNIYDVETWRRYQWSIYSKDLQESLKKRLRKEYKEEWRKHYEETMTTREAYLRTVLANARAFGEALDRKAELKVPMRAFVFAGDCEETLRAPLIVEDAGRIITVFQSRKVIYRGTKFKRSYVESRMFEPGDGRVTRRSVLALHDEDANPDNLFNSTLSISYAVFGCEIHGDLPNNPTFQNNLLSILVNDSVTDSGPSSP